MEMEVMIPSAPVEFNFESASTTPYISAQSSPQRFGASFFSAPTSPTQSSAFYKDFSSFRGAQVTDRHISAVPFDWEVKPGIPKSKDNVITIPTDEEKDEGSRDFAFDFSGQLETCSLSADELFDGGKIKPLKPPPRLQFNEGKSPADSPILKSPRSPKKLIKDALSSSPRSKKKEFDPFAAAHEQTCREFCPQERGRDQKSNNSSSRQKKTRSLSPFDALSSSPRSKKKDCDPFAAAHEQTCREFCPQERGRDQKTNNSSSRQKKTRSLSPFRVSDLLLDSQESVNQEGNTKRKDSSMSSSSSSSFASFWYKKWKLKDLLLFRSASEGRATSKDQMKKYAVLKKSQQQDVKNSSFRSTVSVGSTSSSSSRRRWPVSAHELHYTTNRAVSEEMRKTTYLPYRQNLLGCLGFSSGMPMQEISKGLGSLSRRRG